MDEKEIIIVTDGDTVAKSAVEVATKNIGGRCISISAGNPTMKSGEQLLDLINDAKHNPVVVMVDDCGDNGKGKGEVALEKILSSDKIKILGVIAVASNDTNESGIDVNFSIDKNGKVVDKAVDKFGNIKDDAIIFGDTISVLNKLRNKIPVVVGIGDPGKMDRKDDSQIGAPITTLALREIINYKQEK